MIGNNNDNNNKDQKLNYLRSEARISKTNFLDFVLSLIFAKPNNIFISTIDSFKSFLT